MAADMADRYLRRVAALHDRNFNHFDRLLSTEPPKLSASKTVQLRQVLDREQKQLSITNNRRIQLEQLVRNYAAEAKSVDTGEDVQLAMLRVLLHRYANRVAGETPSLFEDIGPEPKTPLKADMSVADAARLYLHKEFVRPYHYGLDTLCDASNENAELFLHLAGALVSRMETRAIRNSDPALTPAQQQAELTAKAGEIMENWSFPFVRRVMTLVEFMASECVATSLQPNAPLGAGANAFGIPEADMMVLLEGEDELSLVLKFAIAYGAIIAVRNYGQGGKEWCLLELSGPVCLRHGLTLKRGGFLERRIADISAIFEKGNVHASPLG
jgi:hypothetical protein